MHNKMQQQKEASDLDAAIDSGQQIVEKLKDSSGESLIRPLLNLALLQVAADQSDAAITNLNECIALIEATRGAFSPLLIQPLFSLGLAQRLAGETDGAVKAFQRAQHVIHRDDGVYSPNQLSILDQLTIVNIAEGNFQTAGMEQYFYFKINETEYGDASLELIPALNKYAQYLKDVGRFRDAVNHYQRAIGIVEDNYGEHDVRLIELLQGVADVRLSQQEVWRFGISRPAREKPRYDVSLNAQPTRTSAYIPQHREKPRIGDAKKALVRALAIVKEQPDVDISDHIRALVRLGDLYTATGDAEGLDFYDQASKIMQGRVDLEELNNELFALPTRIQPRATTILPIFISDDSSDLFADVEMTIRPNGHPTDIRITESTIPNQERKSLKRLLFNYRFRPRMVKGELVASEYGIHQLYYPIYRNLSTKTKSGTSNTKDSNSADASNSDAVSTGTSNTGDAT